MLHFGEEFKKLCMAMGTTPTAVGNEVGINKTVISLLISGERQPTRDHLRALSQSEALKTTYTELVGLKIASEYTKDEINLAVVIAGLLR